jgi:hypothetical protein
MCEGSALDRHHVCQIADVLDMSVDWLTGRSNVMGVLELRSRRESDPTNHLSSVLCPLPRRIGRVHIPISSPPMLPSPIDRRIGIRIVTFEACSGFTHVTARWIAQQPKAAFVARLRRHPVAQAGRSPASRPIGNYLGETLPHW